MHGVKFDPRGLDDVMVAALAEAGAWMIRHTHLTVDQINSELAKRGELARIARQALASKTLQ